MGRLFLRPAPQREGEARPARTATGRARPTPRPGGGKGEGGMITLREERPDAGRAAQQDVPGLPHARATRVFWRGSAHDSRDVACTGCHRVMEDHSPRAQLAKATEIETCGTCHLQKRAAAAALVAHAAARRQDDVLVVPQPARHGQPGAAQGAVAQRHVLHVPRGEAWPLPLGARPGRGELRQLPRPPRLEPRADAEGRRSRGSASSATSRRGIPRSAVRPRPRRLQVRAGARAA